MAKKTTMYHSGLVKHSPMRIKVTSDAIKSKYPTRADGSGTYFVTFEYDGQEYAYTSENDGVAKFLGRYKGQDITITAEGAREDARINVDGATGAHREASGGPTARSGNEGVSGQPEDPVQAYKRRAMQSLNASWIVIHAADTLREQLKIDGIEMTNENFGGLCGQINRDCAHLADALPITPLWSAKKTA